jgi:hypothetical protein
MDIIAIAIPLIGIIFLVYFFGRSPYRSYSMRKLAGDLGLKFEKRKKLLVLGSVNYRKNIISGIYKAKKIEIYDVYSHIGMNNTVINIDGKNIYSSSLGIINIKFPSTTKIKNIVNEYISTGKIKRISDNSKLFYFLLIVGALIIIWLFFFLGR